MTTPFERNLKFLGRTIIFPALWILYFILSFRVLSRLPVGIVMEVFEIAFLALLLSACAFEFFRSLLAKKVNYLFLIFLPLAVLPLVNAIQASKVFGQPLLYGFASQRQMFMFLGAYFIVFALVRGWVTLKNLERYFLYGIMSILFIMLFFYIFINPGMFAGTDFVQNSASKGWLYQFPNGVAVGIIFYSLIKIWREDNYIYYIHLMLAVIYFILFAQDRSQIAFIGLTAGILFLKDLNLQRKIIYLFYSCFLLIFAAIVLVSVKPDIFAKYEQLYVNATAIITGANPHESSTQVRFYESAIGWRGLQQHPLLGVGFLSAQWNDGYLGRYGYFYPADIGLLGNLYVYGFLGTLCFYIPIIAGLRWGWQMRKLREPFLLTVFYSLLFMTFDMFTAASNIKFIGPPTFCIGVIYYYRFYIFKKWKAEMKGETLQPSTS